MPSSIEPFLAGESFKPEATRAFDIACQALLDTDYSDLVREVVADRIIDIAQSDRHQVSLSGRNGEIAGARVFGPGAASASHQKGTHQITGNG